MGAFFVFLLWAVQAQAFCPSPGRLQTVDVAQVIDGDTLRLDDGRSVRLIGLNTPEIGRKGRRSEPFAMAAKRHLEALIRVSQGRIGLRLGNEPRDRYGRILAYGYDRSGANLEAALLAEGLGHFVAVAPNTELVACHRAAEQQAREAGRGLWRNARVLAAKNLQRGGFALVAGRVERVERNRGGVWLELDGPLVLQVPLRALAEFDASRLAGLAGKAIEARGWVIDRKGGKGRRDQARWMLQLTHPSMVETLP